MLTTPVLSTLYLGIAVIRVILKTPVLITLYLGIAVIRVILKTPVLSTLYLGIAVIRVILKTPVLITLYLGIAVIRVTNKLSIFHDALCSLQYSPVFHMSVFDYLPHIQGPSKISFFNENQKIVILVYLKNVQ